MALAEGMTQDFIPLRAHQGQFRRVMGRLFRSTNARVGAVIVILFVLIATLAPIVSPYNARRDLNLSARLNPPSLEHPLGTDDLG